MLAEIARRFGALPRAQRARWGALVPLGLGSAVLEGLGGAVVFALLTVILSSAGDTQAAGPGVVPSWLEPASGVTPLTLAIAAAAIHLAKNRAIALFTWGRARVAALDTAVLRTRLLRAYVDAPWSFHLQRSSAVLMENMHSSARAWFDVFEATATILTESAVIVALGLVAIAAAPIGVSMSAAILLAAIVMIVRLTRQATRHGGEQSANLGAALYRHVQHSLGAAKEIIILGRGRFFVDTFERDAQAVARLDSRRAVLDAMPRLVLESAFVVGMLALIAAGAATGSVAAMLPLVSLYAYAGFRVIPAAHRIALQASNLRWSLAASAGLAGDLDRLERAVGVRASTDDERLSFRSELRAEDVSFAYEGSLAPVLTHVDVAIRRGESVAIVGATGAGKTTLVDLLIGLLTPSDGRVTVDGTAIDAAAAAWQRNIGYVPQNPFMLDDTLRRNIALGVRDDEIDERAVAAAMRLARLERVAERLPNGLDTSIGEHGVRLSGGERQRVSIARALYHDPELLIFDEATSSLDPATERDIADAIEPLRAGRTIIVIAHRLSTVERCDRVLLLDGGRIAAAGPYTELAAGNAAFRALAAL